MDYFEMMKLRIALTDELIAAYGACEGNPGPIVALITKWQAETGAMIEAHSKEMAP